MKRNLAKRNPKAVQKSPPEPPTVVPEREGGFLSFSYSHREISQSGGRTRIRSRDYRYQNGKLESEEFDGVLDGSVYRGAVEQAHSLMLAQTKALVALFSAWLPFKHK